MKYKLLLCALFVSVALCSPAYAQFLWNRGEQMNVTVGEHEAPVVGIALSMLQHDARQVLDSRVVTAGDGRIVVETCPQDFSPGTHEAFRLQLLPDNRLAVHGSDSRGTAYGLIELTRMLGVSAWEWWADVVPQPRERLFLPQGYCKEEAPSVPYRGIFINDEDWGILPWRNGLGPDVYEHVFRLMLRLRANTLWPAMHERTRPFFLTSGNRQLASVYDIYIGTSHCEPMACNAAGEWKERGEGEYDFVHNDSAVIRFWEERVQEVAEQGIIYTLGMRGVHDGAMQGVAGLEEQRRALERVFDVQRTLLQNYVASDLKQIPQVFIPYKEVLDVYQSGLAVPDDVCLMWCDDNYGYIRHFPDSTERKRSGGNGVYYHVSYWGRPHDYLWLGTASPALLYQQMRQAWERGMRRMWILNVGDIKPAEYQIQLFMDLAWNVGMPSWQEHLSAFLENNISAAASCLLPALLEHYRLAMECKPEFLAGTRVEERDARWKELRDLPWDEEHIRRRLSVYAALSNLVEDFHAPEYRETAYYHLVKYPVQAAAQMNRKHLLAQLARHGLAPWDSCDVAHDSIISLTKRYNQGKWSGFMDWQPRRLPVFGRVPHSRSDVPLPSSETYASVIRGRDIKGAREEEALGVTGAAAMLVGECEVPLPLCADSMTVEFHILPTHPLEGHNLRLDVNGHVLDFATQGRSEAWKQNVLRNQAVRRLRLPADSVLRLSPVDSGIIVDEIRIIE